MKRHSNDRVLIISDTHAPYHHKDTLDFISDIANKFSPDRVIHGGDILDIYSVSSYPKSIEHKDTWTDELKKGRKFVQELASIVPNMEILSSNHDDRAYKASRIAGVPREFLVKYLDVIGAPEGWRIKTELSLTVDSNRSNWLFRHTVSGGAASASKILNKNVCLGHSHTKFGCTAFNNGSRTLWGVDTGCLISDEGPSFAYNRTQLGRPIRGCCMILDGVPRMIPMGN